MRQDAKTNPPNNDRLVKCYQKGHQPWIARYFATHKEWRGIRPNELEYRLIIVTTDTPQEWEDITSEKEKKP